MSGINETVRQYVRLGCVHSGNAWRSCEDGCPNCFGTSIDPLPWSELFDRVHIASRLRAGEVVR